MKKIPHALTMAIIVLTSPLTFAASSTDLTVTGLITPSACTPTLSGGGIVDHGKFSAKDLHLDKPTSLPRKILQLAVNCNAATAFKLVPTDNRPSTPIGSNMFGLGYINGDQKLGSFDVRFSTPMGDGVAVSPLISNDNGNTWRLGYYIENKKLSAFGALGIHTIPIAIKDLQSDLFIYTQIARADSLDLTNDVALDGSLTLDIFY